MYESTIKITELTSITQGKVCLVGIWIDFVSKVLLHNRLTSPLDICDSLEGRKGVSFATHLQPSPIGTIQQ